MSRYRILVLILTLFAVLSCAGKQPVEEASVKGNLLSGIRIVDLGDGEYAMTLRSAEETQFKVLYSKSPYRLVVFAPGTVMNEEVLKYNFSDEVVEGLAFVPGKDASQIEILLTENVDYDYSQDKSMLSLTFRVYKSSAAALEKYGMDVGAVAPEKAGLASAVRSFRNLSDSSMLRLEFGLDGIARYDYGYLDDSTMYVDLFDVTSSLNKKRYSAQGIVSDVKVGEYYPPKKVRFLLKVSSRMPLFAGQDGDKLTVSSEMGAVPADSRYIASVDALQYKNVQSVIIRFIGRVSYTKKVVNNALHLEFDQDVKMLGTVQNRFSFAGLPFRNIDILRIDGKPVIVFTPEKDIYARVDETQDGILVSASFEEFARADMSLSEPSSAGAEAAKAPKPQDLVTLNMKDMDLREAIRLIYFGRAKNVIFGEEVTGKVTLYLKEVDYQTALRLILRDRNLTKIEENGIVWITSSQKYEERQNAEAAKLRAAEQAKELAPLRTEIVPVNFSDASSLAGIVKSVLSKRGSVEVEARTNSFVVRDTPEVITEIKRLMKTVDKRTPQVTIEARIVEVSDINSLNFGVQWGAKVQDTTKVHFPNTVNVGGDSSGYMVNIPAAESVGTFALGIMNRTGTFGLDLALSALESQNKAKTISSPRVTTLDNMEATIKSGSKALIVPSGDDTKTEEIDTGIILKVKPHITSNDMVFLDILVEKSTLGEITSTTATADEKKAETKVLLANGETTVIGGLYEDEEINYVQGVPGLSKLPILGHLFKGTQKRSTRKELLVFLTPYVEK
ncbi:type IV pilus secretin PilQ [Geovibrio ferrireducens]|uniref:type IV pilus secretin PilQ n=1 Tax=Geovibrio ferrireducens TaxID=46201 RepID=UPI002245A5F3|nr:type IV pilus secretin PilQ [Geovibrio ferrireducens]